MELTSKRRPIENVLADARTPEKLRTRLEYVSAARTFASEELGLPDNSSYRSYADLGRPYAVWNVVAAPELSLKLKTWCFPVVGCVGYRGYFNEEAAQAQAARLRAQGLEATVYPVSGSPAVGHDEFVRVE